MKHFSMNAYSPISFYPIYMLYYNSMMLLFSSQISYTGFAKRFLD